MRAIATGLLLGFLSVGPVRAAMLDGVTMPDRVTVNGRDLLLNGIGLRTYSLLHVRVYIAGLYLDQPSHDSEEIIRSPRIKRLAVQFLRDLSADKGRDAWREGFAGNCKPPCHLKPEAVDRFLALVPSVQKGDVGTLTFTGGNVTFDHNGHVIGTVDDPQFTSVILATFIGAVPATERLKQELLGQASH